MKTLADPANSLSHGLAAIRRRFQVPEGFPPAVLAAAETAAKRAPTRHVDRTDRHFVTLDPASATDLDQAFAIEAAGADMLLYYAIADVAWFVDDGDPIDHEAWRRGTTLYLPDGKAGLYPPVLSEGAASLLPDGPRPAVIFTVRVAPDGAVRLDGAERAVIRSAAKLAYDSVRDADLPSGFTELTARLQQVLWNLLSNAIKFTEQGSVTLVLEKDEDEWRVIVTDTGIGIPPHAREYVFEEFRQVDQTSKRKYGGTGLGLAIVQKYTRAMGGSVTLQTELGKGSVFTVSLPLTVSNKEGERP